MKVAKRSQSTIEVGIVNGSGIVLANAMSSGSKVRAQGKTDGAKIMVTVFNDMDSDWEGNVSWLAL